MKVVHVYILNDRLFDIINKAIKTGIYIEQSKQGWKTLTPLKDFHSCFMSISLTFIFKKSKLNKAIK